VCVVILGAMLWCTPSPAVARQTSAAMEAANDRPHTIEYYCKQK
jgi:hypothetical protein